MARSIKNRPPPTPPAPMSTPILTAMVSLYRSGDWLRNRINNLMQTGLYKRGGLLIYCTNADSPDPRDAEIAASFNDSPNFVYDCIPNCSVYATWNHIISKTTTEFLTNANTDDIVAPDCYDILIDACNKHNAPLAYSGWYTINTPNLQWHQVTGTWEYVGYYNPEANQCSCGHFPLWRRSTHDIVGNFDPSFRALGDADWWIRCWRNNIRGFHFVALPLGAYLWRNGGNLWFSTPEEDRAREWHIVHSRQRGKLVF